MSWSNISSLQLLCVVCGLSTTPKGPGRYGSVWSFRTTSGIACTGSFAFAPVSTSSSPGPGFGFVGRELELAPELELEPEEGGGGTEARREALEERLRRGHWKARETRAVAASWRGRVVHQEEPARIVWWR